MKKTTLAAIALFAAAVAGGCSTPQASAEPSGATATTPGRIERGKYLVSVVGCSDCHTPLKMGPKGPEPDMTRYLSGHPEQIGPLPAGNSQGPWLWAGNATSTAFQGPWGISYAANLTPDQNTGLGIWTEDMFVKALRTGRHMGTSRQILPPMPWTAFRNATDEDLKSIYAYLRSIPPVVNHVADAQPADATAVAATK
jgi:hypothetical protein